MGLETGHAARADDRIVVDARRQLEAVAGLEVDRAIGQPEADRAGRDDDDLVVAVVVRSVSIAGSVRPRAGVEPFCDETRPAGARVGHGRRMVPADATRWCLGGPVA